MTLELGPGNMPDLIAGLGMLALAALLLWVAPTNRVHRAFALLQVVNGAVSLSFVGAVGFGQTDAALAAVWYNMMIYFSLAWPFAAAFFTLRFLDPEGRSRASRVLAWCLVVGVTAILGAFALDHGLVETTHADGTTALGPLGLVWLAGPLSFGAMAFLFAFAARRSQAPPRRDGLVLTSLAFTLITAYWSAVYLSAIIFRPVAYVIDSSSGHPIVILLARLIPWAGALMVIMILVTVLLAPPLRGDLSTRRSRRMLGLGAGAAAFTGILASGFALRYPSLVEPLSTTLDGVWRVAMTILLAYALLKRQVFDVEVKLRFAISRSTVAAVFIAVFFVASETAQEFFGDTLGSTYVGIAAAGALVFAIAPLQRAAERLAERAVPIGDVAPTTAGARTERVGVYRLAVAAALRDDGRLTAREEGYLADLAQSLGIGAGDALRVRRDVEDHGTQGSSEEGSLR